MTRHLERRRRLPAWSAAIGAVAVGALLFTGCTDSDRQTGPSPTASPEISQAQPAPTPSEAGVPVLVPDGTATDNLPVFTSVTTTVWSSPEQVSGRAYIDGLIAVGFDKAAMQVTYDQSTVGNPAESIQFSVKWGDECLVGQVGPATGAPVTVVVPALAEGTCLVGQTRPIDW